MLDRHVVRFIEIFKIIYHHLPSRRHDELSFLLVQSCMEDNRSVRMWSESGNEIPAIFHRAPKDAAKVIKEFWSHVKVGLACSL
jgi:hypothetical protein